MRLLIVTQVVDRQYPPLSFFHRWIEEFSKHCQSLTVVSQQCGDYSFAANVQIVSLQKECGLSRFRQVLRFWRLQWTLRDQYDAALVHMTPIWVVLGAPLWLVLGKPIYLWYEARGTKWSLRLSLMLVKKAFSASAYGMPLPTPKSVIVGHGIDTDFFRPSANTRDPHLLATVGRLTRAKRVDVILHAFATLPASYHLIISGMPITKEDQTTVADLYALTEELGISDRVTFETLPDDAMCALLQRTSVFLHASERTSLDKAALQAMACGCIVVSTSLAVRPFIPDFCRAEHATMSTVLQSILSLPAEEKDRLRISLREAIVQGHGLSQLVTRLVVGMSV